MPNGLSVSTLFGLVKNPWMGVVALAFLLGWDRSSLESKVDSKADTVAVLLVRHDFHELTTKVDTVMARQQRILCYLIQNRGPECMK